MLEPPLRSAQAERERFAKDSSPAAERRAAPSGHAGLARWESPVGRVLIFYGVLYFITTKFFAKVREVGVAP
ncbi:hypothetical protein QBA38_42425 [Streptomyces stelliscabiei]|uniref:hypothetical protein n=1 Tax=Streptomyces stelliscabiei TaxID=146820 RepID=UPI002FF3AB50